MGCGIRGEGPEDLEIEPKIAAGGAAIVPAVTAGDDDIGFSNTTSLIIAASKKLPLQIIASGVLAGTGDKGVPTALRTASGCVAEYSSDLSIARVKRSITSFCSAMYDFASKQYTEIPPEVLEKIKLPVFKPDLNEPTIQTSIDLASKYGFIDAEPTLDDLIAR